MKPLKNLFVFALIGLSCAEINYSENVSDNSSVLNSNKEIQQYSDNIASCGEIDGFDKKTGNYNKNIFLIVFILSVLVFSYMIFSRKNKKSDYYNRLIDEYSKRLLNAFGSHLVSVTSYFQSEGGYKPVLLVHLDQPFINLGEIQEILKGNTAFPVLIITSKELNGFADSFPIELVHIKNRYRKCYGNDPIGQMSIDFNNLHKALISSMQMTLMRLRTVYLSQNYNDLFVMETMNRLYSTFEAALFICSQSIPFTLSEIVFKIESSYNIKNSILSQIAKRMENGDTKGVAKDMLKFLTTLEEIFAEIKGISGN